MGTLRKLRRQVDVIVSEVSIVRDYRDQEIRIYTDAGRICRPLVIVEKGKLLLKRSHIEFLKDKDHNRYRYSLFCILLLPSLDVSVLFCI